MNSVNPISNLLESLEKDLELISKSKEHLNNEFEDSDLIEVNIEEQINLIRRNLIKLTH